VCAAEAQAGYCVTSDEDLLAMQEYAGTRIIPPYEFVELLEHGKLCLCGALSEDCLWLNRAIQPWYTGSTWKRVRVMCLGHRVYESRVE